MGPTKPLKIAIYDPYFPTLGGGERYVLLMAEHLAELGHQVHLAIDSRVNGAEWLQEARRRLNTCLDGITISAVKSGLWQKGRKLMGFYPQELGAYDLAIYVTNSLPHISPKRGSVAIVQFPFDGPVRLGFGWRAIRHYFKWRMLCRMSLCIVYSQYAAHWVKEYWHIQPEVVYPPVDTESLTPYPDKDNAILSVARFIQDGHAKKQLELVQVFREMIDGGLSGWRFVLAGGVGKDGSAYLSKVTAATTGYPIEVKPNIGFDELRDLYGHSKIFWHATGLNEDDRKHPGRFEHFGISTVEAMAAGCVPIVINKGGQPEIVQHGKNGFLWDVPRELLELTDRLIRDDEEWRRLSRAAVERSRAFSREAFRRNIRSVLSRHTGVL